MFTGLWRSFRKPTIPQSACFSYKKCCVWSIQINHTGQLLLQEEISHHWITNIYFPQKHKCKKERLNKISLLKFLQSPSNMSFVYVPFFLPRFTTLSCNHAWNDKVYNLMTVILTNSNVTVIFCGEVSIKMCYLLP